MMQNNYDSFIANLAHITALNKQPWDRLIDIPQDLKSFFTNIIPSDCYYTVLNSGPIYLMNGIIYGHNLISDSVFLCKDGIYIKLSTNTPFVFQLKNAVRSQLFDKEQIIDSFLKEVSDKLEL